MTISLDKIMPSCENRAMLAAAYAAGSVVTGLDQLFVGFGAPPEVHWMLAGGGADVQCHEWKMPEFNRELLICVASGYAGGMVASMVFGR